MYARSTGLSLAWKTICIFFSMFWILCVASHKIETSKLIFRGPTTKIKISPEHMFGCNHETLVNNIKLHYLIFFLDLCVASHKTMGSKNTCSIKLILRAHEIFLINYESWCLQRVDVWFSILWFSILCVASHKLKNVLLFALCNTAFQRTCVA